MFRCMVPCWGIHTTVRFSSWSQLSSVNQIIDSFGDDIGRDLAKDVPSLELGPSFSEDCIATKDLQLLMAGVRAVGHIVVSYLFPVSVIGSVQVL